MAEVVLEQGLRIDFGRGAVVIRIVHNVDVVDIGLELREVSSIEDFSNSPFTANGRASDDWSLNG